MSKKWTMNDLISKNVDVVGGAGKLIDAKPLKIKKPSKFLNKKTKVDGIIFDSKKEAERYQDLMLLLKYKKISQLSRQITFPIIINGVTVCKYQADFVYLDEHGNKVVEDTKSDFTRKNPVYRLKKKLMFAVHGITIKES